MFGAQMGPSGSGKTTLLGEHSVTACTCASFLHMYGTEKCCRPCADLLAGRKTVGKTVGNIRYAGHKPSKTFLRRYTGYVEQFGASQDLTCMPQSGGSPPSPRHYPR